MDHSRRTLAMTLATRSPEARRALAARSPVRSSQGARRVLAARRALAVASSSESVAEEVLAVAASSVFADSDETFADVEEVPDSVEQVAASVDMVVDSVDMVPDSVEPDSVESLCPRCGTFHAGGVFGEACYQARRNARRCGRCGLLHEDYDMPVKWFHLMDKFDCEFYIPDVAKLEMDGTRIKLTDDVLKKVEEHIKKQQTKSTKVQYSISQFGHCKPKIHSSNNLHKLASSNLLQED